MFVHHTRAPLGRRHPDTLKCAVVLEALKDEALRVRRYAPSLTASARAGSARSRVGTKKRFAQVEQRNSEVQENG